MHISTISEYNEMVNHTTLHPLVSVIDFSKNSPPAKREPDVQALSFGFYIVFFKDSKHCDIRYGRNHYDYQEGTLIFIAPGQVVSIEEDPEFFDSESQP